MLMVLKRLWGNEMVRCAFCGYEYKTLERKNNKLVDSCPKCIKRFEETDIDKYLNKYWKGDK